jgi:hypothetical protein
MRKSVYKDILNFLLQVHGRRAKGQYLNRLHKLCSMAEACMQTKRCTVEALSQSCEQYGSDKMDSHVQHSKRWLGNKWVDWEFFFLPLAKHFLLCASASGAPLVFVIDGSQTSRNHSSLMVSVLCRGFALPVAWVVKRRTKGHFPQQMHLDLLQILCRALPEDCRVVLLADGEFDGQLLRELCLEKQWEFVLRTSKDHLVDFGGEMAPIGRLQPRPRKRIIFIERALDEGKTNALRWHEKGFEKPIFLLTNLDLGGMACWYYKQRFKIETMFKQLKSKGFQLHKTQLDCPDKISRLLIVAATAFLFTFCMGCFLKGKVAQIQLLAFVRKNKLPAIGHILIAQLCLDKAFHIALLFFSELSKNLDWVFSSS